MTTYKTEAIVLKCMASGEADTTVTFFTPQFGKLTALAKGARRLRSKRAPYLEPLYHSKVLLGKGRKLDFVREVEGVNAFLPLREDLEHLTCGLCIAELIDQFCPEGQEDKALFQTLLNVLSSLCHCTAPETVLHCFKLHLLAQVGYQLELQRCVVCHRKLTPDQIFLSPKDGGTACPKCATEQAPPVSVNALKVMRFLQRSDFAHASRLKLNSKLSSEIRRLLRHCIEYLLDRELKADRFLDTLEKLSGGRLEGCYG